MKTPSLLLPALISCLLTGATSPAFAAEAAPPAPLRALLIAGGCCHDYANQKDILKKGLEERAHLVVDIIYSPSTASSVTFEALAKPDWAKGYDIIIHDECSASVTNMEYINNILMPHTNGLPAVFLHCAMHSFRTQGWNSGAVTPWFEFTGLQTSGHGAQLPIALSFFDRDSEITQGMENWTTVNEELYNNYVGGVLPTARGLVRGKQGASETVVAWTNLYKRKVRVFGTTLGHNNTTVSDPRYLDFVTRGLLWACDKLNGTYLKPKPAPKDGASLPPAAPDTESVSEICTCDTTLALAE